MLVSIVLCADANIKNTICELRTHVKWADYEFVVVDRGTEHRRWLSQQGDIQVIALHDDREIADLPIKMAMSENVLIQDGDEWTYYQKPVVKKRAVVPVVESLNKSTAGESSMATVTYVAPNIVSAESVKAIRKAKKRESARPILHISDFPANTAGITDALGRIRDTKVFDWKTSMKEVGRDKMNQTLLEYILDINPVAIFMEECFTGDVLPETIMKAKTKRTIGVINWCGDMRETVPESMLAMGDAVDWTMMSNQRQVKEMLANHIQAAFLPAGCAVDIYKPGPPDRGQFPADIVFLGSGGRSFANSGLRDGMVAVLHKRYGDKFAVYGRGWKRKLFPWVNAFIEPSELESVAYNSCKIAVGVSAFDADGYTSARMWKAMGSGACYLPHYFNGIESWFDQQKQVAWWRTGSELCNHIDYYLDNESERASLAQRGMDDVRSNHSWDQRMQTALRVLEGRKLKVF